MVKYYNEYDFRLAISKGHVEGHIHVNKFGRNNSMANGTPEAIWNGGDEYTGFDCVAADTLEVFSSSTVDNPAGTGAWTVRLFGLDANWNPLVEDVILDGTTPVDTVSQFIRMDRARVLTAGTGGENAGGITARQKATPLNVMMIMPAGYNSTMIAAWTIPAGYRGFITGWTATLSGGVTGSATVRLIARPFGQTFQVQEEMQLIKDGSSQIIREYSTMKGPYDEQTDIYVQGTADANGVAVAASFDLLVVREGF